MESLGELYQFTQKNGREKTEALLRKYVVDGEPSDFLPSCTTRDMCRTVSLALEGKPINFPCWNIDTEHGMDLYFHMWGSL